MTDVLSSSTTRVPATAPAARRRDATWLALPVLLAGTCLIVLDFFIVNVPMASMQTDLHAGPTAVGGGVPVLLQRQVAPASAPDDGDAHRVQAGFDRAPDDGRHPLSRRHAESPLDAQRDCKRMGSCRGRDCELPFPAARPAPAEQRLQARGSGDVVVRGEDA